MLAWLKPVSHVSSEDTAKGLRMLVFDGMFAQVMGVLTGGAFLVAFALQIGASNKVIGLLAAISPLAQIVQIPSIYLIDRVPYRKALVVVTVLIGRAFWIFIAFLPWLAPPSWRIPLFLGAQLAYYGLSAIAGCAWNSWIRDFVPENIMGGYFAKRLAWATALGAALSLLAGLAVDLYKRAYTTEVVIYSILLGTGAVFGLMGTLFLALTPEPKMAPAPTKNIFTILSEPFKDRNYRMLLVFLGWWNFAINLSAPFFVVFMLKNLHLSMAWVIGLSVVSQLVNVLFFRFWGRLADRYSNKSVLMVSGTFFVFSILLWPFMTMPERHFLTIPLIILFHVLAGMSTAGVGLCAGNIALKCAPYGRATAYLAVNALVSGIAATIAPILAGATADWLEARRLQLTFSWFSGVSEFHMPALVLQGLGFLFTLSFVLGLFALHRLLAVKEDGEVEEAVVRDQVFIEMRKVVKHISNVAGIRQLTHFPYGILKSHPAEPQKPKGAV